MKPSRGRRSRDVNEARPPRAQTEYQGPEIAPIEHFISDYAYVGGRGQRRAPSKR
ncbi:MAG: hypothetical protein IPK80_29015 [Nannocystis sp.]|nr:hypothetical protein [Nannocystis sp.]